METLDLITRSLRSIGVIDATQAPAAEQGANALVNLNNLMASLAGDGIDLGYAPTTDITDEVTIPLEHVECVAAMLALREASDRGIDIPPLVADIASNGRNRLLRQALQLQNKPADLSGFHTTGKIYNILIG